MTPHEVRKQHVAMIADMAAKSFAEHGIVTRLRAGIFGHWTCSRGGSSIYLFNITQVPGRLIVTGDVGVLVVERTDDMLAWCRTAIHDISYFAQKVPQEIPTREYDQDVAAAWCQTEIADLKQERPENWKRKCRLLTKLSAIAEDQHHFERRLYYSGLIDGCDFPDLRNWKSSYLWCREAIQWFLKHADIPALENEPK